MELEALNESASTKPKYPLLDKQKWLALITEWEKGNESQKAFCERLRLNMHTFSYMRNRILVANKKMAKNKFISVQIKEEATVHKPRHIILESINGIKMHVPINVDKDRLSQLLQMVGWRYA